MYRSLARPVLFQLGPETAHELTLGGLSALGAVPGLPAALRGLTRADRPALRTRVAGLDFPNPVGLAAGMDKDAAAISGLFALGFGSLEVGTVTPRPQPGNPRPRVFRIPEHQALVNRMGFNNHGAEAMARRLQAARWRPGPVGVNLGKNKDTPLEEATLDYLAGARSLAPLADYVALNLSSPNTPGLRSLQAPEVLGGLLRAVRAEVKGRPMFLKIAPDLADEAVDEVVQVALASGTDGLICTNTTLARPFEHPVAREAGGLSGRPLTQRSTEVIRRAFRAAGGRLPIIGVGGIFDAADAWAKIAAGASLVQLYTGFVYGGPRLVEEVLAGLEARLAEAGLVGLHEAVGRDA
jgi:dihydroorotate dehydrogenase